MAALKLCILLDGTSNDKSGTTVSTGRQTSIPRIQQCLGDGVHSFYVPGVGAADTRVEYNIHTKGEATTQDVSGFQLPDRAVSEAGTVSEVGITYRKYIELISGDGARDRVTAAYKWLCVQCNVRGGG